MLSTISGSPCACAACGPGGDVEDVQARVADRLAEHEPRVLIDQLGERLGIVRVHPAHLDPVLGEGVREQVVGAAIELGHRDDVVPCAGDVEHRVGDGGLAGGGHDRADAALELGEALLEHVPGRVHDPRVDVPGNLQREQIGGVLGVVEDVGARLVDRDRAGFRGGVGGLAPVQGDRLGSQADVGHLDAPGLGYL